MGRWRDLILAAWFLAFSACGCQPQPPLHAVCEPDSIPEAFARPSAALMWPGMRRAFLVDEHGDLTNGLWRVRFQLPDGDAPSRIAFEDRWRPVAHWVRHAGEVRWDFEAVAFPARSPGDSVLAVSVVAEATNTGSAPVHARVAGVFDALEDTPAFVATGGDVPRRDELIWASRRGVSTSAGWVDESAAGESAAVTWPLASGQRHRARFLLVSHPLAGRELRACARTSHEARARAMRAYWTREIERGTRFQLRDPEVEAALRAATIVLLSCREQIYGKWVPIGGPFHYRDTWIRDGARLIQSLAVLGYTVEARDAARGLLMLQWPQGAFLSQRGQLDGSGQAMWALEQAMLRPAPSSDVADMAESATRSWAWAESQRALGRAAGWPFATLLPFGDPRDNELARAQLVGNDAWMLAGYQSAARLCAAAGLREDGLRIEASRAEYLADFQRALEASRSPDVPPSWTGAGRDWGNIAACWPTRVLAASNPRCARLARRIWGGASDPHLASYGDPDSLHGYIASDLAVWALLADRPESADSAIAAMLHWRTASGGGAEVFSRSRRDFGRNLPPHPTSAAALVTLVRNAILYDDSDTLSLTLGPRPAWWAGSKVKAAPTRWGTLDIEFRSGGETASWAWTPVPVVTRLRVPARTRLAGPPRSPLQSTPDGHFVLAPPGTSRVSVSLTVEAEPR